MFGKVILQEFNSSFWTFTKFSSPIFSPWPTAIFSQLFLNHYFEVLFLHSKQQVWKVGILFFEVSVDKITLQSCKNTCEIVKGQG